MSAPQQSPTDLVLVSPDRERDLLDGALDWVSTDVEKVITTKLLPKLIGSGLLLAVLAWLQDAVGLDLTPTEVASIAGPILLGIAGKGILWVRNAGAGQAAVTTQLLELQRLYEAGRQHMAQIEHAEGADGPGEPGSVPPGLRP